MKVLRQIAITFIIFMLLILAAILYINKQQSFYQRDLVYYNDQLHKIEKELGRGEKESVVEKRYRCSIVLSKDIADPELAEVYRNSSFVLDLTSADGEYIGKVAWPDTLDRFNAARRGFLVTAIVAWVAIFVAGFSMILYFYLYLIKPINELSRFSGEIAKGNYDVTLPIHRHNVFGEFVEAFDLMRVQLVSAKNREMEADKARKELIASLSHDIKTPVAVIKATCEVLDAKAAQGGAEENSIGAEGKPSVVPISREELMEKTATINVKADTISQLVSNMMHANLDDLEQIEVKPTEENSLIIVDFFSSLKQYGNIILENEIPGCLVYMDRLRLEQAIDNIVGNSYKYAGTDIHVRFDSFLVEMPPDGMGADSKLGYTGIKNLKKVEFLRIRIKDDGPGVKDDELPLVAEKYYRGSNSAGKVGSGLGFFLVKYYMEKMRGGVEYYNNDGFVVELLLRKV